MEVKDHANYLCVACGMPTLSDDESTLRCDRCRREYPVVDGIPLLVLRPRALLDAAKKSLRAMEARIAELERMLDGNSDVGGIPASGRVRAERTLRGLRVNGKLIRDHLPTGQGMSERVDEALQLVESVANWGAAWPADAMIPYFYQDWGHTEQFETVRKLVVEVLRKHRSDRAAVAILGAGACGLVQAVADEFDRVYGVDLSIPTLTIAKSVLRGAPVAVCLERAEWKSVQIQSGDRRHDNIQLTVADVANLPFPSNSLSAVVTEWLMDIVGNPEWVASEIRRVLKPGGVWVNFSLPLFTRSIPRELGPIGLEELPLYLNEADLELVDAQHQRVSFLNLERVAENTAALWNSSHFYTARKPVRGSTGGDTVNKKSLLDEDVRWWKGVPHFVSTGGVHISSIADAEFGTKPKSSARMEISFRLQSSRKRFVLREENARCLRTLFELIDGNRTYREIHDALVTKGGGVDASLLPELSHYLSDRLGLISVQL